MPLITGTPTGDLDNQEEIYLSDAPYLYIQDYNADPLNNPDADGYYWGMSGTSTYPVKALGCPSDVSLTEDVTVNQIRCDNIGDKDSVQRRNFVDFVFTLSTPFPLTTLRYILSMSIPTVGTGTEKMGIGGINNNQKFMLYAPKVYDEDTGDYLLVHLHKCKFVDAWTIGMGADGWKITGLKLRAYADDTKPAGQKFGVIVRADASALP
jgi:hypothetical protein